MSRFYIYFLTQLKRVLKLLPALLLMLLLTCISVGFVALIFMNNGKMQEQQKKFQIGIVGDISESYLGFGIFALQSIDDSRYMIDFHNMTEQEAQSALRQGELSAYIRVPDGFVESIVKGDNDCPITYIPSEGQKGIGGIMMDEVSDIASTLVTCSQSAIYGMQGILRAYDQNDILSEATDQLNLSFIEQLLNRTDFCEMEVLGIGNGLSTIGYYFCSFLLFFLMLSGINSSPLFTHKSRELPKLLASKGIGVRKQVLGEYLAYVSLTFIYMVVLFLLLSILLSGEFLQIEEWKKHPTELLLGFFIRLLPVAAMIAALQFLLYEMVTGVVSSILLQFICIVSMGYLSGFFYPIGFFPETIQKIGTILPTGLALRYMNESMTGNNSLIFVAGVFLYLGIFLGACVCVRNYRIQRG